MRTYDVSFIDGITGQEIHASSELEAKRIFLTGVLRALSVDAVDAVEAHEVEYAS